MFENINTPKGAQKQSINFKLVHLTLKHGPIQRQREEESWYLVQDF